MKRATIAIILATIAVPLAAQASPHQRIGMARARAIALHLAPGTIVDSELEREGGGWRYSFDIRQGRRIHEIGVDAYSGRIVENSFEDPRHPD